MQINSTTPSVQQTQVPGQTETTPVKGHHGGHHHKKAATTDSTATGTDIAEISPQGLAALTQNTTATTDNGVTTTTTAPKSYTESLLDNYNK